MGLRTDLDRQVDRGPHGDGDRRPAGGQGRLGRLPTGLGRWLWYVAVASMAADLALTELGRRVGLVELNPVARDLLRAHGSLGLVALKAAVLAFAAAVWVALPTRYGPIVPVCLALPTVPAVVSNAALVAMAVL